MLRYFLLLLLPLTAHADTSGTLDNPFRAYPPSCLGPALIDSLNVNNPTIAFQTSLVSENTSNRSFSTEPISGLVQRIPCEGGKSAVLVVLSRQSSPANTFPLTPQFLVSQGNLSNQPIRVSQESNTLVSSVIQETPIVFPNNIYVLENISGQPVVDFNKAFTLIISTGTLAIPPLFIPVSAYNPVSTPPLPISGYQTGNWFDPAHSGEGAQIEVLEIGNPNTANNRVITFAWYTYDQTGTPFWLFGAGVFSQGDRTATIGMSYNYNGGFAGNFGASASGAPWGNITVQFTDCNTMKFTYQSNAGLPNGIPTGSGNRTWSRASGISGLACR